MRRKIKKSTWLSLLLFVYVTVMAVYFLPRNTISSDMEKYITLAISYIIVIALWFVLRKKEKRQEQRKEKERNKELKENKNEEVNH